MKKALISFVIIFLGVSALTIYVMKALNIEELILCSSHTDAYYIPQGICKYYLVNYRANRDDIQELENGAGLGFIANDDNKDTKYMLMDYFLSKGLNINGRSKIDGLTPLHAAILLNDPELMKYLLSKGADPLQTDRDNGMTTYEYLDFLTSNNQSELFNREAIKHILSKPREDNAS